MTHPQTPTTEPIPLYVDMRNQASALTGEACIDDPIVAVLPGGRGYPDGVATVVAIADGSTSLIYHGGGTIRAGDHPGPHAAALALVAGGGGQLTEARVRRGVSVAATGPHSFLRRDGGRRVHLSAEALEEDLGEGRHDLSDFFHLAHR